METYGLWAAMALYGLIMFVISPKVRDFGAFFKGKDRGGAEVGMGLLIGSVVISWLFAKSITNAANLGASFGIVGAVAYAGWYLSIPVVGLVIYGLRTRLGIKSLAEFITQKYGVAALLGFTLVIMVRLFNEIWSNTAVVGAYFGEAGTVAYYGSALVFAGLTLAYSLRGGMRSSILTDAIQFGFGLLLLAAVLALIMPASGPAKLMTAGEWTLVGGVDLLLVAIIQSLSYAFHDPVLTDRAFLNRPAKMLKGYLIAGAVAAAFITFFGLVGVYGRLEGLDMGQDAPLRVAQAFGLVATVVMSILMMISAGSTIDSTLSSFSKVAVTDLGGLTEEGRSHTVVRRLSSWIEEVGPVRVGRYTMVLTVVLGSLPLFAGTAILKATTISGTMVLGLAPVFLLFMWRGAGPWAFHLAFWPGLAMGFWFAFGTIPEVLHLGAGSYAGLLGLNLWGTLLIFALFVLGAQIDRKRRPVKAFVVGLVLLGTSTAWANDEPTVHFSGQTMLRMTSQMADLSRPGAEVYNVRLQGRVALDPVSFVIEPRLRQSNLRSFSPSNIWLQQAYASVVLPVDGMRLSGGLLYNQLGLFWDDSWFGNLPYLNGHKLDPDMNLELATDHGMGSWGIKSWWQVSPAEDGQNGTFTTAQKAERLVLPTDLETSPEYRGAFAARGRVTPHFAAGAFTVTPGVSAQHGLYDRRGEDGETGSGTQTVVGTELTLSWKGGKVAGELLDESIRGFSSQAVSRRYLLGATSLRVLNRDATWLRHVDLGASVQHTRYGTEGFDEWMVTARIAARIHQMLGVTAEYVRAEVSDGVGPELDRIEWILHIYY